MGYDTTRWVSPNKRYTAHLNIEHEIGMGGRRLGTITLIGPGSKETVLPGAFLEYVIWAGDRERVALVRWKYEDSHQFYIRIVKMVEKTPGTYDEYVYPEAFESFRKGCLVIRTPSEVVEIDTSDLTQAPIEQS